MGLLIKDLKYDIITFGRIFSISIFPLRREIRNAEIKKMFFRLIVTAPLHVEVTPPLLSVHLGGNAEFRCEVSTHPQAGPHFITWYKDGRQLPGTGRQSELLRLNGINREDRGMYQCIVRRSEGDTAQASAELQLGGMCEMCIYIFLSSIRYNGIIC